MIFHAGARGSMLAAGQTIFGVPRTRGFCAVQLLLFLTLLKNCGKIFSVNPNFPISNFQLIYCRKGVEDILDSWEMY